MEGSGAAVYSANNAVILNCTFSGNVAQGGDSAPGGTDSNADGVNGAAGGASLGGGLCNVSAAFLTNCTFSGNLVTGGTGGDGGTGTGTLSRGGNGGNGGNGFGGGLYNAGSIVVVNCTVSGCGGVGGTNGIAGTGRFDGSDGTPGRGRGGDIANGSGTFSLRNSILGASSAGTNAYDTSSSRITDGGYNLSSDASLNLSGTSRKSTDPKLSPLADNGGLTQTMAIPATSPAYNKIPATLSPAADQRGIPRPQPQGGLADIGAYELVTRPAILTQPQSQTIEQGSDATFTVSALGGTLTYQWRFNGTDIEDETSSAYTLSDAESADTGSYDVIVGNNFGSVTSLTAVLSVSPFTISGQVFDADGESGLADVLVQAVSGSGVADSNHTDAEGYYMLSGLASNTYSVVASLACYHFPSVTVIVGRTNADNTDFVALPDDYGISGRVISGGVGLGNVTIRAGGQTEVTDSSGNYAFNNLCQGDYAVEPLLSGYVFAPASQSLTLTSNTTGLNFTAFPSLALARASNGVVQLAFTPAFTCQVQASTNAASANWQSLFTTNNVSTNTVLLQFTDTNAANLPMRFYRLTETFAGLPVLTNWTATSNSVSLRCVAAPVTACQIQASTNLIIWTNLFSTNLPPTAPFQFRYGSASNLPIRFYRLSQTPGF